MFYNFTSFLNFSFLPELFLSISIIYLIIHSSIISSYNSKKANVFSSFYLALLILFFTLLLVINTLNTININSVYFYVFIVDYVSQFSKIAILIFVISCLILYISYFTIQKMNLFEYVLLLLISVLGILVLCSANDLFVAYLAIELQSLSFYILTTFKKDSVFSINAGLKYFILGAIASSFYLFGSSLIYGILGTTNLEDLKFFVNFYGISKFLNLKSFIMSYINDTGEIKFSYVFLFMTEQDVFVKKCLGNLGLYLFKRDMLNPNNPLAYNLALDYLEFFHTLYVYKVNYPLIVEFKDTFIKFYLLCLFYKPLFSITLSETTFFHPIIIEIALILIMSSLFFKLAVIPFNFWLPDIYEGSISSTTSFFAIVPKLSIIIFFIRFVFCGLFEFVLSLQYLLFFVGLFSILYGSFSGIEERKLKSLLAFSAISNMGYILLVLGSNTLYSSQIIICYIIIYMLANLCIWIILFLFTPKKFLKSNKYNKELSNFSNFFKSNPIAAFLFAFLLFSISGLPPFIGFLAKFGIFFLVIDSSLYLLALFSILSSAISTFYYLRLIKIMFFEKPNRKILYKQISFNYSFFIFYFFLLIFLFFNPNFLYLCLTYLF